MNKILYANGCSWSAGDGIQDDPSLSHIKSSQRWQQRLKHTWSATLAKILDRECVNQAEGAGSNKRMVRTTCDYIQGLTPDQCKDTLVVLGWTTVDRNEIFLQNNGVEQWCKLNATQPISSHLPPFDKHFLKDVDAFQKMYTTHVFNYIANYTYFFQEMFLMSNMLENLGIDYLFFSALPWRNCWTYDNNINIEEKFSKQINVLKRPNIINTRDCNDSLNVMSTFCRINKLPMAKDHHTMIEGHKAWAEHLNKELSIIYPR